jgi:hypothetical protein
MLQPSVVAQAMPTERTPHSTDDNIVTEHAVFFYLTVYWVCSLEALIYWS